MNIKEKLLTKNEWSRGGEPMKAVRAVVMHWTGVPMQKAIDTWQFFENRKNGNNGYGSAHYIVDLDGVIIRCIPENEIAYHAGADRSAGQLDPVSGKLYTDESRRRFGAKPNGDGWCPNSYTIGIEMAVTDKAGFFTSATINAAAELVADIIKRHNLTVDDITTHHRLVGWKKCPLLYVNHPELFEAFKLKVNGILDKQGQLS